MPRKSVTFDAIVQNFCKVDDSPIVVAGVQKSGTLNLHNDLCQERLFLWSNTRHANRLSGKTVPGRTAAPPSERS